MNSFCIEIAETVFLLHTIFGSTKEYFRKYLSESAPSAEISVSAEDLTDEQRLLDEEADAEGLKRRRFTDPFLERTVIMRKVSGVLVQKGILLMHGSTVCADGRAYLFTAGCGTGKSTHTRLWLEMLQERAIMLNDDRAFLKLTANGVIAYSSPWSGKHGIENNIHAPLCGICLLQRGQTNVITPLPVQDMLPFLLGQVYVPGETQKDETYALAERIAAAVPMWQLQCNKEAEAAGVAFDAMRAVNRT